MTDLDRLEEITERARKDFLFAEALTEKLETINERHERGDDFFLAYMVRWNAENLMEVIAEIRQLRKIVREAESITKQIFIEWGEDHDVCKQTVDAARDLHNKIKEVMG